MEHVIGLYEYRRRKSELRCACGWEIEDVWPMDYMFSAYYQHILDTQAKEN